MLFDLEDYYGLKRQMGLQGRTCPSGQEWEDFKDTTKNTRDAYLKSLNEWYLSSTVCLDTKSDCYRSIKEQYDLVIDLSQGKLIEEQDKFFDSNINGTITQEIIDSYRIFMADYRCEIKKLIKLVDGDEFNKIEVDEVDPCDSCLDNQECIDGVCVDTDPCQGVTCPAGQECINGECVDEQAKLIIWMDIFDTNSLTFINDQNYGKLLETLDNKGTLGGQFDIIKPNVGFSNEISYNELDDGVQTYDTGYGEQVNNPAYISYSTDLDIISNSCTVFVTLTYDSTDNIDRYFAILFNGEYSTLGVKTIRPSSLTSLGVQYKRDYFQGLQTAAVLSGQKITVGFTYDGDKLMSTIPYNDNRFAGNFDTGGMYGGQTTLNILNYINNSYINPGLVHEVRVYDKKMSDSEITNIKQEMISKYGG